LKKNDRAKRSMLKQLAALFKGSRNWLFLNESVIDARSANDRLPRMLFLACIVFYGLYLLVMQSEWVLGGEMWAEMATNYYPNAASPSLAVKLFSTDAGYIPLPQRILAIAGHALHFPAAAIPYFYTWIAILLTAAMVGAFCLAPFRPLVKNDFLRFLAAVSVLLVADFESRTFINFTYFAAFFVAIVTALALVQKSEEVPWWSWLIPVLMLSKPAVLSVVPAMILGATVSGRRFRFITIAVLVFCLAQILRMMFSHSAGAYVPTNEFSLYEKIYAATKYFVGFLGAFSAGKAVSIEHYRPLLFGLSLLFVCLLVLAKRRTNAGALIIVGLSLLLFNALLNVFALSDMWNLNMQRLIGVPLYRHIIVGYFGVVLVIVGLVDSLTMRRDQQLGSLLFDIGPVLYLSWFYFSGWFLFLETLNRPPGSPPVVHNSQWQSMAAAIDSGADVCVPVDPLGWVFGRHCAPINPNIKWLGTELGYRELPSALDGFYAITVEPPISVLKMNLMSLAILIKPHQASPILVNGSVEITMSDGSTNYFIGHRQLPVSGGLLVLTTTAFSLPVSDIKTVKIRFDKAVEIGFASKESGNQLAIIWMGAIHGDILELL